MEKGGQQRASRMKMHIEAAAAAGTDDDDQPLEDDDDVKKKRAIVGGGSGGRRSSSGGSVGAAARRCQTENCTADLVAAKQYHRRHRVCEYHAKTAAAVVGGVRQRFCQQCSRFHELSEFDETRRSCRRRLAGHNERRRKNSSGESHGDSLGDKGPQLVCGEVDDKGKIHIAIPQDNAANYKHFNIR